MAIDFHKWKAEPSYMHSHAEHGNERARAKLSRFVFSSQVFRWDLSVTQCDAASSAGRDGGS